MKRSFITFSYGYENDELVKILKKSIDEFSNYELKVYNEKDFALPYNYEDTEFWKSGFGYIMKINTCIKSLTEFDEVVWLDTDIVVTEKIDDIWKHTQSLENYPLLPKSRFTNFKSNPTRQDPQSIFNHIEKLCNFFEITNVDIKEVIYLQACAMLFNEKSKEFFEHILSYFINFNSDVLKNGDECITNGLMWKNSYKKNLGNVFLCSHFFHGNLSKVIKSQNEEEYQKALGFEIFENNFNELLFFHGTKSLNVAQKILWSLITYKKNKTVTLGEILESNGSDKSTKHNYTELYSTILDRFVGEEINIFELGIGTNDTSIPWNMTLEGKPGASLYSWLEYFPNSTVFAADIDPKSLINNEKIHSFQCNQLELSSIKSLWSNKTLSEVEFDIMILDGVHTFEGNLFFLENSIYKLKKGGVCIIEDIHGVHIESYRNHIEELKYWFPYLQISLITLHKSNEIIEDNSVMIFYKK
jgi:hypothetical protein